MAFNGTAYAYCVNFQVTALPSYGGKLFPFAIGAVVDGVPTTVHTPLSGQLSPVLPVVPNGAFAITESPCHMCLAMCVEI